MTFQTDCVFVMVPYTDSLQPFMAPAILKSIATMAGKSSATVDLNAEFVRFLEDQPEQTRLKILDFFREDRWHDDTIDLCLSLISDMAEKILSYNPRIVGLSVFTYNCQTCTKYLSWILKRMNPDVKIILGGAGIIKNFNGRAIFAENLLKNNLIDLFIYGDGEHSLYHYLTTGNTDYPGINSHHWQQLGNKEIESLPMPDYDDYDFSLYAQPLQLPMISSRGCVRRCSFCDVHSHWNKYTYRTGQHIFNEMITLHEKYKVKSFHFVDSLINGNLKEYRNLTKLLAEYNQSVDPQEKFSWYGYFIIRPKEDFTEQDWQLTSLSGAKLLNTGLETLNESVRKDIGKNFSNQDVEFSFQMAKKYGGIKFNLLLITGFPNETLEDYEFQIQWWKEQTKYKDIIEGVNTGNPLGIIDNTPLKQNFNQLGLVSIGPYPGDWVNPKNNNTPEERVKWNDMLVKAIAELGYTNSAGYDSHYIIERMRLKS